MTDAVNSSRPAGVGVMEDDAVDPTKGATPASSGVVGRSGCQLIGGSALGDDDEAVGDIARHDPARHPFATSSDH